MVHFKFSPNKHPLNVTKLDAKEKVWENPTQHSVWTQEEVDGVKITHLQANDVSICEKKCVCVRAREREEWMRGQGGPIIYLSAD